MSKLITEGSSLTGPIHLLESKPSVIKEWLAPLGNIICHQTWDELLNAISQGEAGAIVGHGPWQWMVGLECALHIASSNSCVALALVPMNCIPPAVQSTSTRVYWLHENVGPMPICNALESLSTILKQGKQKLADQIPITMREVADPGNGVSLALAMGEVGFSKMGFDMFRHLYPPDHLSVESSKQLAMQFLAAGRSALALQVVNDSLSKHPFDHELKVLRKKLIR